ncbi:MerR family transcriptional regulator [Nostoc sp. MS1]|uniref:MerR family transcriptional regulator n=1 Tax=Nostoc sp. MS1 TaxID=2764711 RepID=UPI001CC47EE1|nr:MerR family transcriptional regulator [Nostoc sp. MS1]BCL37575.1 MerR family transcriptional regulator [Nostoc sp. MS1]
MFKIGDFSRLGQVSVRMLRHYDDLGLLKPSHVDQWTDYRYYTIEQLPRLNRILALKDLGLSLEKIAELLQHDLPLEPLQDLLRSKQTELHQQMQEAQARLDRLSARLYQLELEGQTSVYDVIVKSVPACHIASARHIVPVASDMPKCRGILIEQLYRWLSQHKITPVGCEIVLYHISEYAEADIDMEFAIAIPEPTKPIADTGQTSIIVRQLAAAQVASVFHDGMVRDVTQAIAALFSWIGTNGYISSGAIREIHLFGPETKRVKDQTVVLELQIPIVARQRASFDPLQPVDKMR